jgi:phosphate transport system permease protein
MHYLFGDVTLILTSAAGQNRLFSLYVHPEVNERRFGRTKEFPALPGAAGFYAISIRNKAFLIGAESHASLRYATTETVRWQDDLPFEVALAAVGGKYDRLAFLDRQHRLAPVQLERSPPGGQLQGDVRQNLVRRRRPPEV